MHINKKVLLIVFVMLSMLSVLIIGNVFYNFVNFGKKETMERANSIAESVRDGLTAHMTLGAMDQRELFLSNMIKHQNVKNLRVLRSKKIIDVYGEGEIVSYKYDDIEKQVLVDGKRVTKIVDNHNDSYLRVTIPYIASKYSTPNCLSCHTNVKEGEVLGAITLKIDIADVKDRTFDIIFKIVLITFGFLIIAFFISRHFIKPYIQLFDDLEEGISRAYKGDFSYQVKTILSDDAAKVASKLNDLSEIFRFKKTIETDIDKPQIYERIAFILENHFKIKEFLIFENATATRTRKIVYKSTQTSYIESTKMETSKETCRAFRTNNVTSSSDFHKICNLCYREERESLCLPFSISEDYSLTLLIYTESLDELQRIKELVPIITNYFEITEPVLQTKTLMNQLSERSLKDPLTTLYNRRFLDEYIDKNITDKTKLSVMMLDIDHFKRVNDTYGHDIGDKVIVETARVFKNILKGSDLAIRYGGEEFVIITFNTSEEAAVMIANNIREEFSKIVFTTPQGTFSKTLSIGISNYPQDSDVIHDVIKFADTALYYAKENGRNQVITYTSLDGTV
jgi:diguanylate cyclase (GGDEF)-like protein